VLHGVVWFLLVECPLQALGWWGFILALIVAHGVRFDAHMIAFPPAVPVDATQAWIRRICRLNYP